MEFLLEVTQAKKTKDREWLKEVSSIPLQQSLNDLNTAYQNFFNSFQGHRKGKSVRPPKFKSKKSRQTARFTKGGFKVGQYQVYLATIGKLKVVWPKSLPSQPTSATIIKDLANRYFLSFVVEIQPEVLSKTDNSVGIDLGLKTFATLSNGTKIDAPKPLKKQLRNIENDVSHYPGKTRGTKRYEKAKLKLAKFHGELKDTRTNFLHKLSTKIKYENQVIV
ncbi:MAG: transposase [Trichodesmium sp. MAG_R03]|nr:transposase [Trichodesmium sp. MAG_R03]